MRIYELVLVLRPALKDADKKKILDMLKALLKEVKIVKEDDWGQKPLAYAIKKEEAGHYYLWHLESEIGVPAGFEQKIIHTDNIIRHLLLRTK